MKRTKEKRSRRRRTRRNERLSRKVALDFLRVQIIVILVLVVIFVIAYLASKQYDNIYRTVRVALNAMFGYDAGSWIMDHKVQTLLLLYAIFFLASSFVYSIGTLHNFNKTWMSLPAILNDDEEIRKFSKGFSDVEIRLKDIKHQVYRQQRIAAQSEARKNDLVMYLAHDLKTPLTSVIGYLTMLTEAPDLPAEQRAKYVGISLEKANRLEQLINEFFEITRYDLQSTALERNRIDLGMMVQQIVEEFYPMLRQKGLDVQLEIPQRIVMYADADKIARVLDNLLKNAVAYSYENSVIRIGAIVRDGDVCIKMRNRCDEISPEKLARIFDKFFRVDAARATSTGGSGLGLAITKQIVEQHGGEIRAYSCRDYTDFTVRLPYESAE